MGYPRRALAATSFAFSALTWLGALAVIHRPRRALAWSALWRSCGSRPFSSADGSLDSGTASLCAAMFGRVDGAALALATVCYPIGAIS